MTEKMIIVCRSYEDAVQVQRSTGIRATSIMGPMLGYRCEVLVFAANALEAEGGSETDGAKRREAVDYWRCKVVPGGQVIFT